MLAQTLAYLENNPKKYCKEDFALQEDGRTECSPVHAKAHYRCAAGTLHYICHQNGARFRNVVDRLPPTVPLALEFNGTFRGRLAAIRYLKRIIPKLS